MDALRIEVEDLAIDEELVTELAFLQKAGSRFERIYRAKASLAISRVKSKQLEQSIASAAECYVVGKVAHVIVVVDPLTGYAHVKNYRQLAHAVKSIEAK